VLSKARQYTYAGERPNVKPVASIVLALTILTVGNLTYAQENSALQADTSVAESRTAILEEKVAALEMVNRVLENRVFTLEAENRNLESNFSQCRHTLHVVKTAGRKLSINMARRVVWNVSRHIAGMTGTAIPYVGAGVSVAMTAVDVQQGCESVKDLNAMNREMNLDTEDEAAVCGLSVPTKDQVIADVVSNWQAAYTNSVAWTNQNDITLPSSPALPSSAEMFRLMKAVMPTFPTLSSRPW
jgi:hypothetical protein